MITDVETNTLYLSRLLAEGDKYREFWKKLNKILTREGIPFCLIDNTSDIWCRDYMPVQVSKKHFVQFTYRPSYCMNKKHRHTITDTSKLKYKHQTGPVMSDIILDGGNIVKTRNRAIMTDIIFRENKNYSRDYIIAECKRLLRLERIDIVPRAPFDYTGHADGMVRFLDDTTLLVTDYSYQKKYWQDKYRAAFKRSGLKIIPFPSYSNDIHNSDNDYTAMGCYINFAQIGHTILFPQFGSSEDRPALKEAKKIFPDCKIIPTESGEIAMQGGVLNCITWNICI